MADKKLQDKQDIKRPDMNRKDADVSGSNRDNLTAKKAPKDLSNAQRFNRDTQPEDEE